MEESKKLTEFKKQVKEAFENRGDKSLTLSYFYEEHAKALGFKSYASCREALNLQGSW